MRSHLKAKQQRNRLSKNSTTTMSTMVVTPILSMPKESKIIKDTLNSTKSSSRISRCISLPPISHDPDGFPGNPVFSDNSADLFDIFCNIIENRSIQEALSISVKQFLDADDVQVFDTIPLAGVLYCKNNNRIQKFSEGLIGACYVKREILLLNNPEKSEDYEQDIDIKSIPLGSKVIVFPLLDSYQEVQSIILVIRTKKNQNFTETNKRNIETFQQKYQILSKWCKKSKNIDEFVIGELLKRMQLNQFLTIFRNIFCKAFECERAEIWKYDKDTHEIIKYSEMKEFVEESKCGIISDCLFRGHSINCLDSRILSSFSPSIDGTFCDDNYQFSATLILPLGERGNCRFAIALRGRKESPFSTEDEAFAQKMASFALIGLQNADELGYENSTESFAIDSTVDDLKRLIEMYRDGHSEIEILQNAISYSQRICKAQMSVLYMYDEMSEKFNATISNGKKFECDSLPKSGIAGKVLHSKRQLNANNADDIPEFYPHIETQTGTKVYQLLATPIFGLRDDPIAVCELVNSKEQKPFSEFACQSVQLLLDFAGIILKTSHILQRETKSSTKLDALTTSLNDMSRLHHDTRQAVTAVCQKSKIALESENFIVYTKDAISSRYNLYETDMAKVPETVAKTLIGKKAQFGRDCPLGELLENRGIRLHNITCLPLIESNGKVFGSFVVINAHRMDRSIAEAFAAVISKILEVSKLETKAAEGAMATEMKLAISETEFNESTVPLKLQLSESEQVDIRNPSFDAIAFGSSKITKLVFALFEERGLIREFRIPASRLYTFCYLVKEHYEVIPFHNIYHAADSLQYAAEMLRKTDRFGKLDSLCLLLSSFCLNIGHKGTDDNFNKKMGDPFSMLFNESPLTMRHCAVAIEVLEDSRLLDGLESGSRKYAWALIFRLIRGVSQDQHDCVLHEAEAIDAEGARVAPAEARARALVLAAKMASLAPFARGAEYARWWLRELVAEGYTQGDFEAALGQERSVGAVRSAAREIGLRESVSSELLSTVQIVDKVLPELAPMTALAVSGCQKLHNVFH